MRRNSTLTEQVYNQTYDNVYQMKEKFPDRILLVQEEELMKDPSVVMQNVFKHVGLEWKDDYLNRRVY